MNFVVLSGALLALSLSMTPQIQTQQPAKDAAPALLAQGTLDLDTPEWSVKLARSSQTIAALRPKGQNGFNFAPSDRLEKRAADGYHHPGDLTLRVRKGCAEAWRDYDTAAKRAPVAALPTSGNALASAD